MSTYEDLVKKLKEIFQIDKPELDFGVYRILNFRLAEINDYLENRLKSKVIEHLTTASTFGLRHLEKEPNEQGKYDGINPNETSKVMEFKEKISIASDGISEYESAIFSHLLTFFSRYYESGDFISQRRYKGNTYAIPYAGEEVVLHWANKDQYYTKSAENFSNYGFKLDDGRKVRFRLVSADTAKDNRNDNDKERRFVLVEPQVRKLIDQEGETYEEILSPIEESNGDSGAELVIFFEYKAMPKGTKQDSLVVEAAKKILNHEIVKSRWLDLSKRAPTEKNPQRTVLEKCLTNYTNKNTADYFIHKNLERFLRNELDFYIKNEMMQLDDLQHAQAFADIERKLVLIQIVRAIATELIVFLSQIEEFQKKLWLKKKFVVRTDYCVTLDRVPESLYKDIITNTRQWQEWHRLGILSEQTSGTAEYLKANPSLMVDTSLFNDVFKYSLLAAIENLDDSLDGLVIHGDNFQALGLLQNKYAGSIKSIYIDPPYNTDASAIVYKNNYKDSSWLCLIDSRLNLGKDLLNDKGVIAVAIDDIEFPYLTNCMSDIFGKDNMLGVVVARSNPSGRSTPKGIAEAHDYAIFAGSTELSQVGRLPRNERQLARYSERDEQGAFEWVNFRKHGGIEASRSARRKMYYPIFANTDGTIRLPNMNWNEDDKSWVLNEKPASGESIVWPINNENEEKRWKWGVDSVKQNLSDFCARPDQNGKVGIYLKSRMSTEGMLPVTWWDKKEYSATEYGTNLLKSMFGKIADFSFPKALELVKDCLRVCGATDRDLVLDFFAGSGTTAHAVIELNRADGARRKYILVEMGEYIDSVLIPRIQKAVYASEWKDGKPKLPSEGFSHAFKILILESYEDTLNNLVLNRNEAQQSLLDLLPTTAKDDYLLRYFLDFESKGSLLSLDQFRKPFDCKLKVSIDSAGAYEEQTIDLVETFNYLIGLRVTHLDFRTDKGFAIVTGTLNTGEKTLVLWRDADKLDYENLNQLCRKLAINPSDSEFDLVYINCDHNIPTVFTASEAEGSITRTLKIRQIEQEFLSRMFAMEMV